MSDGAQGPGWWQASDGRWYPPQPPAGEAPAYAPAMPSPPQQTAGKATATLILGIASFVFCPVVAAVAALIVGAKANREIRESQGRLGGEGLVTAGRILAIIHLALSVVTVPIMAAIAIPTFLGAQERAQDRAVQSDIRNALTAEKVFYVDHEAWTADPVELATIEPTITYRSGGAPSDERIVHVVVEGDIVGLGARSASGTCFYVTSVGSAGSTSYATDDDCGPIEDQNYVSSW